MDGRNRAAATCSAFYDSKARRNLERYHKSTAALPDPNIEDLGEKKTLSKLKELRKREFAPDASYDLTGDGHVSAKELLIAGRFDKNKDGILDAEERKECIEALKNNYEAKQKFGQDYGLMAGRNVTPSGQLAGQEAYGLMSAAQGAVEGAAGQPKSRSAVRHLTRSELLSSRRKHSKDYEKQRYGEFERRNAEGLRRLAEEAKRSGPKIFENTTSEVVVQDHTWTDRTMAQRGPEEIRTLENRRI